MVAFLTSTSATAVMFVSGVVPGTIAYWLRNERHKPAVGWFQLTMISTMVWSFSFAIMSTVDSAEIRLVATHFYVLAVSTSTVFTFLFCYEHVYKESVSKLTYVLFLPPLIIFLLSWINPLGLIYTVENPYRATEILIPANPGSIRPFVTVGLGYSLVILAFGMVFGDILHSSSRVRKVQSGIILVLIGLGAVLGMIKFLDLVPSYFDPTPIGWAFAGLLFAVSIKRYRFIHLSPPTEPQVIDGVPEGMYIYDLDDKILMANTAAKNILDIEVGLTKQEVRQRNPALEKFTTDTDQHHVTLSVDGTTRIFNRSQSTLPYGYGAEGQIIVLRDVTALENKRQQLAKQNERLTEFATELSHDLRNPLNVATGNLELAKNTEEPTTHIRTAEDALERMGEIIDSILQRARSGRQPRYEPVSLETTAKAAWTTVETRSACLTVTTDQTLSADSTQLLRLFENLFRNSIEHGGTEVTVYVGATSGGFFVADDGPGIPKEHRADIFEKGVTYSKQGTGRGLAIVSNIVDAHGWAIAVSASEYGGVRFDITGIEF